MHALYLTLSDNQMDNVNFLDISATGKVLYFTGRQWESCQVAKTPDSYLIRTLYSIDEFDLDSPDLSYPYFVILPANFSRMGHIFSLAEANELRKRYHQLNQTRTRTRTPNPNGGQHGMRMPESKVERAYL